MKNSKNTLIYIIGIVFIIAIIFSIFNSQSDKVCFDGNCFEVELAITEEEQYAGLGGRELLEENNGMLFVFEEEGYYPFWMKGMLFPLDIIWINDEGVVVDIIKNAEPCGGPICFGIYPEANASYVLELNAYTSNKIKLDVGDSVDITL